MKLTSLKEKPATKEDIGKVVYGLKNDSFTLRTEGQVNSIPNLDLDSVLFWQKPKIISEAEYNKLKEKAKGE